MKTEEERNLTGIKNKKKLYRGKNVIIYYSSTFSKQCRNPAKKTHRQ